VELDKRGQAFGVRAYTLHPGAIPATALGREVSQEILQYLGVYDEEGNFRHDPYNGYKKLAEGASTTVWCATSPKLANIGGVYCEDTEVAPLDTEWQGFNPANFAFTKGVTPQAVDPETAQKLWTLNEQLIGTAFIEE
jgi:hypothetical protein